MIAVDSKNIYGTYTGYYGFVLQVALADGATTVLVNSDNSPAGIAVDSTNVYYSDYFGVYATPINGGSRTQLSDVSGTALAVHGSDLYWTSGYGVMKVPVTGGAVVTVAPGGNTGETTPNGLALDATNLYWTQENQAAPVVTVPLAGGNPVTLGYDSSPPLLLEPLPQSLAVDSSAVYWLNNGLAYSVPGSVMKASLDGSQVMTLASDQPIPQAIAVDATSVYWTSAGCLFALTPK